MLVKVGQCWSILVSVSQCWSPHLAVQTATVLIAGGAVKPLVAGGALEAAFVPLGAAGQLLLRGVNRLQADAAVVGHLCVFLNDHFFEI